MHDYKEKTRLYIQMNSKEQLSCINCLHKLVSHVVWWGEADPLRKGRVDAMFPIVIRA